MKTKYPASLLTLLAAVAVAGPLLAQPAPKDFAKETAAERDARMGWFREARFGMFIHWGVYSVPAGEWNGKKNYGEWFMEETHMPVSEYEKFAAQFNPVKFDAKAWARTAKNAGMKYMVITSKHHDGFGMYRSELTDWCMKSTPFPRDPLKELAAACKDEGLTFCLYHSIMDWHHPDWGTRRKWNDKVPATPPNMDRYTDYMKGQLKELLTGYGPIGIVWFDGEWESPWTHDRGVDFYNFCRSLQPNTIVNNRVGKGRAGMNGMDKGQGVGDYGTPEQEIPATGFGAGVDWESCMTMNGHWGYNKNDQSWKSAKMLIQNLINCASKGGNYLLNVGPTGEGLIPGPSIERLAEMGAWMKVNGEAIYGTTASPFKKLAWGKCTQKPGKLYLHVFDWPKNGILNVPIANEVKRAYLLAKPTQSLTADNFKSFAFPGGGAGTSVGTAIFAPTNAPAVAPDPNATVIVLEIDGAPQVVASTPTLKQAADGTLTLKATDAEITGNAKLEAKSGDEQNIGSWTSTHDFVEWTANVTKPGTFDVELNYACDPKSGGQVVLSADLPLRSVYRMNADDRNVSYLTAGNAKLNITIPPTKSWADFTVAKVGQLKLDKAGPVTLALKPVKKQGEGVLNLRSVVLKPRGE